MLEQEVMDRNELDEKQTSKLQNSEKERMLFVLHNMTPEERSTLSGNYLERSLEEIHRMSPEERAEMERLDTVGILQLEKEWMASLIKDMIELDSKVRNTEPMQ